MGINRIPSTNVSIRDKSDLLITSTNAIFGTLVEGEKGFEDIIKITRSDFKTYLGDISKVPLSGRVGYVGAVKMVNTASSLYVGCLYKEGAQYGGVYITDQGLLPFDSGSASLKNFTLYKTYNNEVLTTCDGIETTFDLNVLHPTIMVGSVTLKYRIGTTNYVAIISESGVISGTNISSGSINFNTGKINIIFSTAPTATSQITATYTRDSNQLFNNVTIGISDGVKTDYEYTIPNTPIKPESVSIKFTYSSSVVTVVDDGLGVITGSGVTGTINYSTGVISLVFTNIPDNTTIISIDYVQTLQFLGALIAYGCNDWSNRVSYKISEVDNVEKTFTIQEYETQLDGTNPLIKEYTVSRDKTYLDGFGKNLYIEDVFKQSYLSVVLDNDDIPSTVLPKVTSGNVYMSGGANGTGTAPTGSLKVSMVNNFKSELIPIEDFGCNGYNDKPFIDAVNDLINFKKIQGWGEPIDGTLNDIVTYMNDVINLDSMRMFWYAPWCDVSFNGSSYVCAPSAIALEKRGRMINNNKYYMSPSGVGEDFGSISIIKFHQNFEPDDQKELSKVGVNTMRNVKSYGPTIYDNITSQKKTSTTSFQNSVITLNTMIRAFESFLPQLNLNRVINDDTILTLQTLIESYMRDLERNEGTIEPEGSEFGWFLKISELNDASTRDNKEVNAELVFSFQSILRHVNLQLTYVNNQLITQLR